MPLHPAGVSPLRSNQLSENQQSPLTELMKKGPARKLVPNDLISQEDEIQQEDDKEKVHDWMNFFSFARN